MSLTIYHNPRCSKSRASLEILQDAGCAPDIVHYLETPPDAARILSIARMLGRPVAALLRTGEDDFRNARDLPDLADDAALAAWLARHPRVLERPVVVDDERGIAVIGRPPGNVSALTG